MALYYLQDKVQIHSWDKTLHDLGKPYSAISALTYQPHRRDKTVV